MPKANDDFYAGVIAALAVVALHDEQTLFDEIVATCDEKELIEFAQRDGAMGFSGLERYGYGKQRRQRDARATPNAA